MASGAYQLVLRALRAWPRSGTYKTRDPAWHYLFNSYYQSVGPMHARPQRGLLSRPSLDEVFDYRERTSTMRSMNCWPR
jgi:hypothetical protein